MEKYLDVDENGIIWPDRGKKISIDCFSTDDKEQFEITINTSRIKVEKITYQQLYCDKTILFRIDYDGPRHQNPNGEYVGCPHIHIYKEGYGDKWAYPLSEYIDCKDDDILILFKKFLAYINVKCIPNIKTYQLKLV